MRKAFRYIFISVFIFIIVAVLFGNREFEVENLGQGFFLTSTSGGDRAIGKDASFNQFTYAVYGHITNYAFDSKFILAKRVPRDSVEFIEGTWEQKDKQLQNNPFALFYIIDKKRDSVTGPLSKSEFLYMKEKLQVTETLTLR